MRRHALSLPPSLLPRVKRRRNDDSCPCSPTISPSLHLVRHSLATSENHGTINVLFRVRFRPASIPRPVVFFPPPVKPCPVKRTLKIKTLARLLFHLLEFSRDSRNSFFPSSSSPFPSSLSSSPSLLSFFLRLSKIKRCTATDELAFSS